MAAIASVEHLRKLADRGPATGERVDLREWPTYKAQHGLHVLSTEWPAWSPHPIVTVEVIKLSKGQQT
jgi:hypothetical protein